MAKFCGNVGYIETIEESPIEHPGVFVEKITLRKYYGDVMRNTRRYDAGQKVNGDIDIGNSISIMADGYAYQHFFAIRFVEWMGSRWNVTGVDVQRPRLILTIGGLYNGNES